MTLEELKVSAGDVSESKPDSEEFKASMVLLAAMYFGPKVKTIARFCGFTEWYVRKIAERMRKSGIWTESGKIGFETDLTSEDPETQRKLQIEFALHTCVALGWMERTTK